MFAEGADLVVSSMMKVAVKSGSWVTASRQQRNLDAS